jgi:hypothetical protein
MNEQHYPPSDDQITPIDKITMWMFLAAAVVCLGLGAWAMFFRG